MTQLHNEFEEIRPYRDDEVKDAISKLINEPEFVLFARYFFPDFDKAVIFDSIKNISSIAEFQKKFIAVALDVVIKRSIDKLTSRGLRQLEKQKPNLFISNHRDIVLDSSLINLLLFKNGLSTSEIAIGGNLLISPMITHLVKLNKSFIVKRNVPPRELYNYSKQLSSYISHTIFDKHESVWIAQREGRAKDGNDKTHYGLLKMLVMNDEKNIRETFIKLRLLPVAISYEYDPCDVMKAIELYLLANKLPFEKTPIADFQSMITGIQGYKGRVEVAFSKALTEDDYNKIHDLQPNDWLKNLATLIDQRIYKAYRLWGNNYISYDLLNETAVYQSKYSEKAKNAFIAYVQNKIDKLDATYPKDEIYRLVLNMYANPLKNKLLSHLTV